MSPVLSGPLQKENGVRVKAFYVPGVEAGGLVRVQSAVSPKLSGEYKVHGLDVSLDAHAEQWTMAINGQKIAGGQ